MNGFRFFCFLILPLLAFNGFSQASDSPLAQGKWYKVAVSKHGIYKITADQLKSMGFDLASADPRNIVIYGNEGGVLPQKNSDPRPDGLQEIAIQVKGEEDGKINSDDYILFYGEGPYRVNLNPAKNVFAYERNIYADKNFYFISISENRGKRILIAPTVTGGSVINFFNDFFFHELESYNELHSGREWFGEKLDGLKDLTLNFEATNILPGSAVKIVSEVMGQSYTPASFKLLINGSEVGQQNIVAIPMGYYSSKGYEKRDTFLVDETTINASARSQHEIKYQFLKGTGFSQGYLDFILVNFKRKLTFLNSPQLFSSAESLQSSTTQYEIETSNTANVQVWDISDFYNASQLSSTTSNGKIVFSAESTSLKNFAIFGSDIPTVELIGAVQNQNIKNIATPDLLIVTHPDFIQAAERLAAHRASFNSWTVKVVTTQQIYDEFSSGKQDISAIRDYTRRLYKNSPGTLKVVLLFGKGSYDYKNRLNNNTNFVPIYESRVSLLPLQTYASDDFYGFMEDEEGDWSESPIVNHTLDIGVGRLPVTTLSQANAVVDKIIAYDQLRDDHGPWRKKIVFVADDGNTDDEYNSLHQSQANQLAVEIDEVNSGFDTKKLFMGTYQKVLRPNGESVPELADDIVRAFDYGSLIINFTGHGSEKLWTDERILTETSIAELENKIYPFLVTATCEFGRNDDPFQTSSAELSVLKENGGAIGIVSTTRPVNAFPNFGLNQAFYQGLFKRKENGYSSLGDVFKETKNNSFSGVSNRNFMLLADPSLTLALPPNKVVVSSVSTEDGSDTLKALSTVIVKGEIQNAANIKLESFNGIAEVALFDKQTTFRTIGRNDPAFEFNEWHNILFRGKASVKDGEFEIRFILPKNISYTIAEGKLSLYASSKNMPHATGYSKSFKIGGSQINVTADLIAPEIQAFIGDTTFIDGGVAQPDTDLIVLLKDESGVNISDYGLGNSLQAILDDGAQTFILNSFYVAKTDDYRSGTVRFPLKNLTPGPHRLIIKGWDVYNNPGTAVVNFVVTDGNSIEVKDFAAYPNPTMDKTTLFFTHNRSGDDLQAKITVFNSTGLKIFELDQELYNCGYQVNVLEMNTVDKKLPPGIYIVRLNVRSLTNGSKSEHVAKVIILN